MSRWIIGLLLFVSAPISAGETNVGYVVTKSPVKDRWLVNYKGRQIDCVVRRSCDAFVVGRYFIPVLMFTRATELVDYLDDKGSLTECMLRECRDI